jgi:hypothetical protein
LQLQQQQQQLNGHLIDVDVGHGEELVQALKVALLNGAKDGGQNEIILLKKIRNINLLN